MKKNRKHLAALLAAAVSGLAGHALLADVTISEGVYTLTGEDTLDGNVTIAEGATLQITNGYRLTNKFYGAGTIEYAVADAEFRPFNSTHAQILRILKEYSKSPAITSTSRRTI